MINISNIPQYVISSDKTLRTLIAWYAPNMTCRKNQYGEYRINVKNGSEDTACYTSDRRDAFNTAIVISRSIA